MPDANPISNSDDESKLGRVSDLIHRSIEVYQILLLELEHFKHKLDSDEDLDREVLKRHIDVITLHVMDGASVLEEMRRILSNAPR